MTRMPRYENTNARKIRQQRGAPPLGRARPLSLSLSLLSLQLLASLLLGSATPQLVGSPRSFACTWHCRVAATGFSLAYFSLPAPDSLFTSAPFGPRFCLLLMTMEMLLVRCLFARHNGNKFSPVGARNRLCYFDEDSCSRLRS